MLGIIFLLLFRVPLLVECTAHESEIEFKPDHGPDGHIDDENHEMYTEPMSPALTSIKFKVTF